KLYQYQMTLGKRFCKLQGNLIIKHIKKDVVRISLVAIKHRKKLELLLAEHLKKKQMILTMYRYAMELRKNAGIKGFLILNYSNFIIYMMKALLEVSMD